MDMASYQAKLAHRRAVKESERQERQRNEEARAERTRQARLAEAQTEMAILSEDPRALADRERLKLGLEEIPNELLSDLQSRIGLAMRVNNGQLILGEKEPSQDYDNILDGIVVLKKWARALDIIGLFEKAISLLEAERRVYYEAQRTGALFLDPKALSHYR